MNRHDSSRNTPAFHDFVPGYAFYNAMGEGLAESITRLVENVIELINRLRV